MARRITHMSFRQPMAVAATRQLPRGNRLAAAGMAIATAAALLVSPPVALGMVGLMLWQALSPE